MSGIANPRPLKYRRSIRTAVGWDEAVALVEHGMPEWKLITWIREPDDTHVLVFERELPIQ